MFVRVGVKVNSDCLGDALEERSLVLVSQWVDAVGVPGESGNAPVQLTIDVASEQSVRLRISGLSMTKSGFFCRPIPPWHPDLQGRLEIRCRMSWQWTTRLPWRISQKCWWCLSWRFSCVDWQKYSSVRCPTGHSRGWYCHQQLGRPDHPTQDPSQVQREVHQDTFIDRGWWCPSCLWKDHPDEHGVGQDQADLGRCHPIWRASWSVNRQQAKGTADDAPYCLADRNRWYGSDGVDRQALQDQTSQSSYLMPVNGIRSFDAQSLHRDWALLSPEPSVSYHRRWQVPRRRSRCLLATRCCGFVPAGTWHIWLVCTGAAKVSSPRLLLWGSDSCKMWQ